MKRLLFGLCIGFYTLYHGLYAGSIEASVNTTEIVKGNTVELSIRASGGSAAFPKISEIAGIVVTNAGTSTSTSMSISSTGMKKESTTIKKYIFVPEKDMLIPSYSVRVGSEILNTKPITIKVIESNAPIMNGNSAYSFRMKSSKRNVVVGESFFVTLYLSLADSLGVQQISEYVEPSSSDFFFKDLGKQKQYKQGNSSIVEKQYSVTAKKEGNFTIASASAKIGIADTQRRDLFGRYGIRWISTQSNSMDIKVKSLSVDTDLIGEFTINSKLDKAQTIANKPINLSIEIKGKGNLEDLVLPKYEIDGVTIYEDEPKIQSHKEGDDLVSIYRKNIVFISDQSFTIPKYSITAYNSTTHKIKNLEIKSYDINIEKKKGLTAVVPTVTHIKKSIKPPVTVEKKEAKIVKTVGWWMLFISFIFGIVTMYIMPKIYRLVHLKEKPYKESEALKILYAHISEDKDVEQMVYKLYARKNGDKSINIDKKELKFLVERFR